MKLQCKSYNYFHKKIINKVISCLFFFAILSMIRRTNKNKSFLLSIDSSLPHRCENFILKFYKCVNNVRIKYKKSLKYNYLYITHVYY